MVPRQKASDGFPYPHFIQIYWKFHILEIRFKYGEIGQKGQANVVSISTHNLHFEQFQTWERIMQRTIEKLKDFSENEESGRPNIEYLPIFF